MKNYDHKRIEKRWQREWAKKRLYKTKDLDKKEKFYVLDMFPYPSGEGLHVGHPKGYIATDVISRMKRMQGKNVLHPMGFDAFGLPAENYAIKMKTNPAIAVAKNVARYKKQLEILGFDYDWSREINTTDPKYYKWTQWIFLKLLEKGLAYESYEPINWCPVDKTGLANEDVEDGKCERCGALVEKKSMRQWVLKITDYAERLLSDLDTLDWPTSIKESQRNWIGRSYGALISFQVSGVRFQEKDNKKLTAESRQLKAIEVFTTRPDTLFGVTYLVLAPEHPWLEQEIRNPKYEISNKSEIQNYINETKKKTEIERTDAKKEKTGVEIKGIKAINPANNEEVPIFVADYVLADYGTGAVMAVPAHDERDFLFAKKYKLPIKEVVLANIIDKDNPPIPGKKIVPRTNVHPIVKNPRTGKYLALDWKHFDWTTFPMGGVLDGEDIVEAAKREVKEETGFVNLKLISVLPNRVRAEYFAAHKDQNRISYTTAVVFELVDDTRVEVDQKEKDAHEIIWLSESDLNYDVMTHAEIEEWKRQMTYGYTTFVGEGVLVDSGKFSDMKSEEAKKKITEFVGGKWVVKYKLKDWVFSRQRYWGEPFPILHDGDKVIPVAIKDLPVILPKVKSYEPSGTGESPLATIDKWVNVKVDPKTNKIIGSGTEGKDVKILKRETNTMPQWAGSSWYYLRYMDPKNNKFLVESKKEKYWNSVDLYVGGAEHATRHLIYARFWHKFLYDIGVVSTKEPFKKLQSVGLIMGEDGRKMSKRFGNVVNPDDIVATYGADTLRIYECFMGPFDQAINWSTQSMIGSRRFVERVWKLAQKVEDKGTKTSATEVLVHKTIAKVTEDIETMHFNTAISSLMILLNEFEKEETISRETFEMFLKLLAPFAPHITEELWIGFGNKKSIHLSNWPVANMSKIVSEKVKIAVQVNGKVRAVIEVDNNASESIVRAMVEKMPDMKKWISDKKIIKTIYIPNRVMNLVING